MIFDLKNIDTSPTRHDICIVGSGPAGMTLANELSSSSLRVCVLESGNRVPTPRGDALRKVGSEGIHINDYSRERVLGGASTTWAGLSSPLDEIDMVPRDFVSHSGWPIRRDQLVPYYESASLRYEFPSLEAFDSDDMHDIYRQGDATMKWSSVSEKVFLAHNEPTNFGARFEHIFRDARIDLYTNATVLSLSAKTPGSDVDHAIVRSSDGRTHLFGARRFVIATGGIENARILLNSKDRCERGLGNEHDQVGRYLMNHPKNNFGIIQLNVSIRELPYYFGFMYRGFSGFVGLRLSESKQRESGCLNSYVRMEPIYGWSDNVGVRAAIAFVKNSKSFFDNWKQKQHDEVVSLRDYAETGDDSELQNARRGLLGWCKIFLLILVNLPCVFQYAFYRLIGKRGPQVVAVRLRNFMEMAPREDNRVILGSDKDLYGQPVPRVKHSCGDLDKNSLMALHERLAEELSANGFGQLESDWQNETEWPINMDASHHMGTTRMGSDPKESVVDSNCRVHSVSNVYMAGASVFPTSGCANPTFTIVALAIRLAEHLRSELQNSITSH